MSKPVKNYQYVLADRGKMKDILQDKKTMWKREMKKVKNEESGQRIQQIFDALEATLLDSVNMSVPYKYQLPKDKVTAISLEEKQLFLKKLLDENLTENWKTALNFINDEVKNRQFIQSMKTKSGRLMRKHEEIATYLNSQWTAKTIDSSKLVKVLLKRPKKIVEFELSPSIIAEKIDDLPVNKSHGTSSLTNEMLKLAPEIVSEYLYDLYSMCLKYKRLPAEWVHSQVTPAFKDKGDRDNEDNYRPISVSPTLGKLFEHIVADYLNTVLEDQHFFHPRQHGHRKGYSNESQLACFMEELSMFTRNGSQVDCIKIDLKSATNFVNHKLLMKLILNLPIDEKIYNYIKVFLKNHVQTVKVGKEISPALRLMQGLPQGSPMTNPLFLVYINGIYKALRNHSRIRGFGDDILMYREIKCKDDQYSLQEDIYCAQEYLDGYGLEANPKKIQTITFFNPKRFKQLNYLQRDYLMYGVKIPQAGHIQYLGLTFSENLTFFQHINEIYNKYNNQFDKYLELVKLCCPNAKILLYKAVLRPKLEMLSSIWNPRSNYSQDHLIAKLESLQQKCAAFVLGKEFHSESWHPSWADNLEALALESLHARRIYFGLKLREKIYLREPSFKEMIHIEKKHVKCGIYDEMKTDYTSLNTTGKAMWRRMVHYFEENPFRDLSIEECCQHWKDKFCAKIVENYTANRRKSLEELRACNSEVIAELAKIHPYGLHHLL